MPLVYFGAFLDESERKKLLAAFPPSHPKVFADHLTIKYRPDFDELKDLPLGKEVELKIVGRAEDDKAQALLVETDLSQNKNAHITISTANDTEPVYSNELIEQKVRTSELDKLVAIKAKIGYFNGKAAVTSEPVKVKKIILPTRSQPDTLVAICILKTFGDFLFPGIKDAPIEIWPTLPPGDTPEGLREKGVISIDIGGGTLDHHTAAQKITASRLVAEYLAVDEDPALAKLLEFAERDDFFGKGIVSDDPLDRAFGLPGLLVNLNKKYTKDPAKVVEIVLPLLEAHLDEEIRRTKEMPIEVNARLASGEAETFEIRHRGKKIKCIFIISENISLPGFLRSQLGGKYDIVAQQFASGHINVLTRPAKRIDLRDLAAVVRKAELMKAGKSADVPAHIVAASGRIKEVPNWYYDTATNSLQNGGAVPKDTPATVISRKEFIQILSLGLSS